MVRIDNLAISKGDVLGYYESIAERMLPFLVERPLTLKRYPDGVTASGFYQKNTPEYFPEWIERCNVKHSDKPGLTKYVICNSVSDLMYLVNQGTIEFHGWMAKCGEPERPDKMIIDLDPPDTKNIEWVRACALAVKNECQDRNLAPYLMSSGAKGLHIMVIKPPVESSEASRELAKDIALSVVNQARDKFTVEVRKAKRGKRIFIDYLRNSRGQTSVLPYSLRANEYAGVAVPLRWDELQRYKPGKYTIKNVTRRLSQLTDSPWPEL